MLQTALENLFNYIYNDIVTPLRLALINSQLVNNLNVRLNNIVNSIFNLFREVPVDKNYIDNNALAELVGVVIAIYLIYIILQIARNIYTVIVDNLNAKESPSWRPEWKRKRRKK